MVGVIVMVVEDCDVWILDLEVDVGVCVVGLEVFGCWVVEGLDVGIVGENVGFWVEVLDWIDFEGLVIVFEFEWVE